MKSALFVDFDNVYSGLKRLDPRAAERFALQPLIWIRWLTQTLATPPHAPDEDVRRLLVRRCYLNPQAYQRFRPAFNRAGFEIVDCPAMTSEGKTSTDIHMVLDIVDLLQHETRYDEFIVFSADADFTPVLRKLRRWDRRTTVLAIGFPSAAYQASADLLIDQDEFVRGGLDLAEMDEAPAVTEPAPPRTRTPAPPHPPLAAEPAAGAPVPDGAGRLPAVAQLIRSELAKARRPVPCGRLAQLIAEQHGELTCDWAGKGTFRKFLDSLDLAPLQTDWSKAGGCVLDPTVPPTEVSSAAPAAALDWGRSNHLLPLIRQVHAATDLPMLSTAEIRMLLDQLAADVVERPFLLSETGKRVRDRCRDAGEAISRANVSFVLKSILLGGHAFGQGRDNARTLGASFVDSVLALCQREQLLLDESQTAMLREWVAGPAQVDAEREQAGDRLAVSKTPADGVQPSARCSA